jgi:hypothetical protein
MSLIPDPFECHDEFQTGQKGQLIGYIPEEKFS